MANTPKAGEHPLISHGRFRDLYTRMLHLELLEARVRIIQKKAARTRRLPSWAGEEAVRVATTLDLTSADAVADSTSSLSTDFLRGLPLSTLLHQDYLTGSKAGQLTPPLLVQPPTPRFVSIPMASAAAASLDFALGAAALLQSQNKAKLVVAFTLPAGPTTAEWKQVLTLAARHDLPMLFVALPGPATGWGKLSALASSCGVPGIPVDAADAVALYRVTQESFGRARAGGGPALLEAVSLPTKTRSSAANSTIAMRQYLLSRGLSTDAQLAQAEFLFTASLDRAER